MVLRVTSSLRLGMQRDSNASTKGWEHYANLRSSFSSFGSSACFVQILGTPWLTCLAPQKTKCATCGDPRTKQSNSFWKMGPDSAL